MPPWCPLAAAGSWTQRCHTPSAPWRSRIRPIEVETRRRTLQAADLAVAAGEPARSLELVNPLLAALDGQSDAPADAPALLSVAATAHSAVHGAATALPWLERAAALLPEGSPERARQLGRIVWTMLYVDVDEARARCLEFVAASSNSGDRMLEQIAHANLRVVEALGGLPVLPSAEPPDTALDVDVIDNWLEVAVWTDEHLRAEQLLDEGWRRIAERRSVVNEHNLLMHRSDLLSRQGRLDEAAELAERCWALADAADGGSARSSDLAVIAALRGDTDTAHRHVRMLASGPPEPVSGHRRAGGIRDRSSGRARRRPSAGRRPAHRGGGPLRSAAAFVTSVRLP